MRNAKCPGCVTSRRTKKPRTTRELIESAKRTGAPDPRVVSLMTRGKLGTAWVEYWNKLLYQGVLPHKLKEMCRIRISVAHQCGYCSTVRSNVAKAEGLTEDMIGDLFDYAGSKHFTAREKAALHYADLFKQGEHAIDKDEVYADLAKHFSAMKRSSSSACSAPRSTASASSSNRSTS